VEAAAGPVAAQVAEAAAVVVQVAAPAAAPGVV
jgi:hypothetical protein